MRTIPIERLDGELLRMSLWTLRHSVRALVEAGATSEQILAFLDGSFLAELDAWWHRERENVLAEFKDAIDEEVTRCIG